MKTKKYVFGCKSHPRSRYAVPVAGCTTCAIAAEENKSRDSLKAINYHQPKRAKEEK